MPLISEDAHMSDDKLLAALKKARQARYRAKNRETLRAKQMTYRRHQAELRFDLGFANLTETITARLATKG
jgi:hypothetical protein